MVGETSRHKTYTKRATPSEIAVYTVLTDLADTYNPKFEYTVLPKAISSNLETSELSVQFYDGETFNDRWNEENGGLGLGLDLATEIPGVLADLATIDTALFTESKALATEERLVFDYEDSLQLFTDFASESVSQGLLSEQELEQIQTILLHRQTTEMIVSNGDFYPRNFIKQSDAKIVLIDWDTWNDGGNSPFYLVDHPENVAATLFVHMWKNQPWQDKFLNEIQARFNFDETSLLKGITIKALTLAHYWYTCLLYTSPSPRDRQKTRMPSSA